LALADQLSIIDSAEKPWASFFPPGPGFSRGWGIAPE
jgi:hypothetical protein